jgi:tRNA wybutosine-synthesizing protein 1
MRLRELLDKAEPTTLYISLYGPDKETHIKTCKPLIPDSWERLMESLTLMSKFRCRKVIRLTLVKDVNMHSPDKYAELIKIASPDFVECKGYTHVGESQLRLRKENMPSVQDLRVFGKELAAHLNFIQVAEDEVSRVVLLSNPNSPYYLDVVNRLSSG